MPMWVMENLSTNMLGPLALSHRTVLGRRLWCLNILNIQAEGVLCLAKTWQLALSAKWFVGSTLELVSLALIESKSAFLLPSKPKPWSSGVFQTCAGRSSVRHWACSRTIVRGSPRSRW